MGPQINVVGSFFPSWMLCATIGIVVTLRRAARPRPRRDRSLPRPPSPRVPEPGRPRHPRALGGLLQGVTHD